MTHPHVTIGLLWHSMNSDNLGVGALTIGNMAIIEDAARAAGVTPRFKVLGWSDPRPLYFTSDAIDVVALRARDLNPLGGRLARIAAECDLVFDIGAGDSFADIYGPGRISKMLLASNIILNAGTPMVLSPQTIGPFKNPVIRRAALNIMRRASAVTSRDHLSTAFAHEMGYDGPLIEASDVALRLPYEAPQKITGGPVRVGINVSGLLFNGGYSGRNMFGLKAPYADLMRAAIRYFTEQPNCEIHLVGHVLSDEQPIEDDYRVCVKLAQEFPNVRVAPKFTTPSDAKSYIAGMDFFIGARMHACIAAFSGGVPVLPMAYSRKFEGFFGALGYGAVADCKTEDAETILGKIRDSYRRRAVLREEVIKARSRGFERLKPYEELVCRKLAMLARAAA